MTDKDFIFKFLFSFYVAVLQPLTSIVVTSYLSKRKANKKLIPKPLSAIHTDNVYIYI